jgi:hypothetical protein
MGRLGLETEANFGLASVVFYGLVHPFFLIREGK